MPRPKKSTLSYLHHKPTNQAYVRMPDGKGGRSPDREATAINHFCLESDDLDATAATLKDAGVKLTVEPKMGADGNRQCWVEDPDGNRIEFMQMSADSMQAEAIRRMRGA